MIAVEMAKLSYSYHDGTMALQDINLSVKKGKKTAILGSNGSGKTTLLYHFNGTFLPQAGSVTVMGSPVSKKSLQEIRQKVGLLFDNPDNQLISTTVFNDIAFGPRNLNLEKEEIVSRVNKALKMVDMAEMKEKPPHNLSLGQKKKAAIAGLLVMEPEIIVCDEPFSGLDPQAMGQLTTILDKLVKRGCTLIFSTHDVDLAYAWADEVVILKEGKILSTGSTALLADRKIMATALLNVPLLAQLFKDWKEPPCNVAEALALLSKHNVNRVSIEKQVSEKR